MMKKMMKTSKVSPLGSDLTFCRLTVNPLPKEELMRLNRQQKNGLEELVRYEEDKILEKKRSNTDMGSGDVSLSVFEETTNCVNYSCKYFKTI